MNLTIVGAEHALVKKCNFGALYRPVILSEQDSAICKCLRSYDNTYNVLNET